MPAADAIASPCINICSLDPNQEICLGCFRYLHEIEKWNSLSDQEKVKIVDELDKRKALITMR
jgi:uncharacterized protein